jgi:hypothetical protein
MTKSRRLGLRMLTVVSLLALAAEVSSAQTRSRFPSPPPPADAPNPAEAQASQQNSPPPGRTALLEQNEKELRDGVARLYMLASELKQEVDRTPTADVFSVEMYRRMKEIAKLAKQLQSKAKG